VSEKEIVRARDLFTEFGEGLTGDRTLTALLDRYEAAIGRTKKWMRDREVVAACSACAGERPGSCCFQGVEEWYDAVMLLVNLLLGVELDGPPELPDHCRFVGENGCRLSARHAFCVNYLCPSLQSALGPASVKAFARVAGEELSCGWETERFLRSWFQRRGVGSAW
jgi:hypothetical protein